MQQHVVRDPFGELIARLVPGEKRPELCCIEVSEVVGGIADCGLTEINEARDALKAAG